MKIWTAAVVVVAEADSIWRIKFSSRPGKLPAHSCQHFTITRQAVIVTRTHSPVITSQVTNYRMTPSERAVIMA